MEGFDYTPIRSSHPSSKITIANRNLKIPERFFQLANLG